MALSLGSTLNTANTQARFSSTMDVNKYNDLSIDNGQILPALSEKVVQARSRTFIRQLEKKWPLQDEMTPLKTLLKRLIKMPDTPENRQSFVRIRRAFVKEQGYLARLFSKESWVGWAERRTALGLVIAQIKECRESCTPVRKLINELGREVILDASKQAESLLQEMESPKAAAPQKEVKLIPYQTKSGCVNGLIGGTVGSLITNHPLPLFLGLSECLPVAHAQQPVGSEFQVNTYTNSSQVSPSVASWDNGNFVITWRGLQGGRSGIHAQLFSGTGSKIRSEFPVYTNSSSGQIYPSVASLNNGHFVITWYETSIQSGAASVYGQIFDATSSKIGNEFQVNTYTVLSQVDPSVTSLNNGNFVVTWTSNGQDGDGYGIVGQLFNASGGKIGNEFLVNTSIISNQDSPSVASLKDGNFIIAWHSIGIYGQIFDAIGSKIGSEFQVNTSTALSQVDPSVTSLNNGNFVVTWTSNGQDGDGYGIVGQLFNASGGKIGNEFLANTYTISNQDSPSVTGLKNGNFVISWASNFQDRNYYGIYSQMFTNNSSKVGKEFQVNTYIISSQNYPSIASIDSSSFVIAWQSDNQEGSFRGIYGQIFNTTLLSNSTTGISGTFDGTGVGLSATSKSNELSMFSDNSDANSIWIWALLGVGGGTLCLSSTGVFLYKKLHSDRSISVDDFRNSAATNESFAVKNSFPPPDREDKGHTEIGDKYALINKISQEEASALFHQTGIKVSFPKSKKRAKVLLGRGNFGKLRIARSLHSGQFTGVKKIKGENAIRESKQEGSLQSKLNGKSHIMPILDFVETLGSQGEPVLYQFMPLAGFGNGEELQALLHAEFDNSTREQVLTHVAQGLLSGLAHMHEAKIYHFDIKPSNIVLDRNGELFIIDFGCAKEVPSGTLHEAVIGDNRYFSPERMGYCQQLFEGKEPDPIDSDKVDAWAAGITLLELATNTYPFNLVDIREKLTTWDTAYYQSRLDAISELRDPAPDSTMEVIKGLLDLNLQTRLNVQDALMLLKPKQTFADLNEQQETFASLKRSEVELKESPPREEDENYFDVYLKSQKLDADQASYEAIARMTPLTHADEGYAKTPAGRDDNSDTDKRYSKTPSSSRKQQQDLNDYSKTPA